MKKFSSRAVVVCFAATMVSYLAFGCAAEPTSEPANDEVNVAVDTSIDTQGRSLGQTCGPSFYYAACTSPYVCQKKSDGKYYCTNREGSGSIWYP